MVVSLLLSTELVFTVEGNAPEYFKGSLKSELITQCNNSSVWNFSRVREEIEIQLKGLAESNITSVAEAPVEVRIKITDFKKQVELIRDPVFEVSYFNKVVKARVHTYAEAEVSCQGKSFHVKERATSELFYYPKEKTTEAGGAPSAEFELSKKLAKKILLKLSPLSGN